MRVLVLNAGSSSLKYRLVDGANAVLLDGTVERIGEPDGNTPDHAAAIQTVTAALTEAGAPEPQAVGHRVVHGGEALTVPTLIDDEVVATIAAQVPLAPLHNPANLQGIAAARRRWPDLPQVAVFDTAFHATIPSAAHRYALPTWTYTDHGVRRYGFHGTSHAWVSRAAIAHLGMPAGQTRVVTLHLGNGASAAAVRGGRCVDTSMGMSPLEGLVMGTRSGDVDPAVAFHLMREADLDAAQVEQLLNRESGLKGLAGDNDMRTVHARAAQGDADARLAIAVYVHRIRRYVGAFAAVLGGIDALVFTAGVGEHSPAVRAAVCADLDHLGIAVDAARNAVTVGPATTTAIGTGATEVLVVPTDEEAEIAAQTRALVAAG